MSLFANGQAYVDVDVDLSRVKSIEGQFISALDHNTLLKNHDRRSLAELDRLRKFSGSS